MLAHAKRHRPKVLDQDEPDARARRDRRTRSSRRWTICARRLRHPDARAISAADRESPAGRALRDAGGVRRAIASRRSRAAFSNASRARWCARAIAPSARSRATTAAFRPPDAPVPASLSRPRRDQARGRGQPGLRGASATALAAAAGVGRSRRLLGARDAAARGPRRLHDDDFPRDCEGLALRVARACGRRRGKARAHRRQRPLHGGHDPRAPRRAAGRRRRAREALIEKSEKGCPVSNSLTARKHIEAEIVEAA